MQDLGELTTHCIRCGFCLEACPTFQLTGAETEGPRGRIYLVRSAVEGQLDWEATRPHLDRCLGCRACETACPSGVEYGAILEMARERLGPSKAKKMLLKGLTDPKRARLQFALANMLPGRKMPALLNRLIADDPAEARIPKPKHHRYPPLVNANLPLVRGQVALLLGCVMRVLYDPVHEATKRLLRRIGYETIEIEAPCCGSLHAHAGLLDDAKSRALNLSKNSPPDMPILVNSAGCGSTMKGYGQLDPSLIEFASRVQDVCEFLFAHGLADRLAEAPGLETKITYHDACHLAHGQRVTEAPRALLKAIPKANFIELQEADRCCGSAGIYNLVQPKMARHFLDRKWEFIRESEAQVVATGNPGCLAWIEQAARENGAAVEVLHTVELLERSFAN